MEDCPPCDLVANGDLQQSKCHRRQTDRQHCHSAYMRHYIQYKKTRARVVSTPDSCCDGGASIPTSKHSSDSNHRSSVAAYQSTIVFDTGSEPPASP